MREAEAALQAERDRMERLLQENAALSERAQQLQLAAAQPPQFQNPDMVWARHDVHQIPLSVQLHHKPLGLP